MIAITQDIKETLKEVFGFDDFRPNQDTIVNSIINKQDVFAVMPTGGGKSLCYQLPAKILSGTCLVVSPLISLMKDQVDSALELGINAAYLNSTLGVKEKRIVIENLKNDDLDLLYVSPERFAMDSFIDLINSIELSFIAIDEAHCISEWGHDFRPDYLSLSMITTIFPKTPIAAFTATATERVQEDIIKRLKLRSQLMIRASFDRPNLYYRVVPRESTNKQILKFLSTHKNQAGIIYRTSRKNVEKTAEFLAKNGINALPYHAGLTDKIRKNNQNSFNLDKIDVIVATIAFGMGIDKSNVRFVLHADLPKNMEGYYQETGRAGRDGEDAECLLLFSRGDIPKQRYFIDAMESQREKELALKNLQIMTTFAEVNVCRRKYILDYFQEKYIHDNCKTCDVCNGEIEQIDATIDAQKVMSAVARSKERFGAGHIIDIVTGAETDRIFQLNHNNLKTYGVGKDKTKKYWKQIIDDLLAQKIISKTVSEYPTLFLAESSKNILNGSKEFFTLKRIETKQKAVNLEELQDFSGSLFEELRKLRMSFARKKNVPPFVIFSDKSLKAMAGHKPKTNNEMLQIHGVGKMKLEQYGNEFLEVIGNYE